jgi:hypothetical protein
MNPFRIEPLPEIFFFGFDQAGRPAAWAASTTALARFCFSLLA